MQDDFGHKAFEEIEAKAFSAQVFTWRDAMAASPRQADYGMTVLKLLLSWGCRRGLIDINRAAHVDKLYRLKPRANSWRPEQIEAFMAAPAANLRLAMMLALETGQ